MLALILSVLVSGAVAQRFCTCNYDDTRGYWGDAPGVDNCTTCDLSILDTSLLPPGGTPACTVKDICKDVKRPLQELSCYGAGTCQNNVATPCNCTYPNADGKFCEKCKPGFQGWPYCTTALCAAPVDASSTCNLHGSCIADATPVACGVTGCFQNPSGTWSCQSVGYVPNSQVCNTLSTGASQALTLGPGQSPCGTAICAFGEKCVNGVQQVCCKTDEVACAQKDTTKKTVCCHKTATCCDGVCCSSFKSCTAIVSRFAIGDAQMNSYYVNGALQPAYTATDPQYTQAWGGGPWTDWKMRDGTTVTPWRICTDDYLGGVAVSRVIVLPSSLVLALIVAGLLVYITTGLRPVLVSVPAFLLMLCSLFIFFTPFWPIGVLIALAALFAMGSCHRGGTALIWGIVVQVATLAVVCGGLGLGRVLGPSPGLFFSLSGSRDAAYGQLDACANFYNFFRYDTANIPFDSDPDTRFRDYCSTGWYSYLGIIAACVVFLQLVLLAATGRAWLKGEVGGK